MDYLSTAWNLLGYISLPVVYILNLIFSILNIVTAPLQHLVQYTAYACWYPISLLAKFEVCLFDVSNRYLVLTLL